MVVVLVLTASLIVHELIDSGPQTITCTRRTTISCQLLLCLREKCAAEIWLLKWLRATSGADRQVGVVSPSQTVTPSTAASSMTRNPSFGTTLPGLSGEAAPAALLAGMPQESRKMM